MGFMKSVSTNRMLGRGRLVPRVSVDMFFDRQLLTGQMSKAERRALNRAGATVRTVAKRSMRSRPVGKASSPGMPPHRHKHGATGKSGMSDGLYKSILYGFDAATESVVIGPSSSWGPRVHALMETHEFGGFERKKNARRKLRRVGGTGEIRIGKQAAQGRDKQGRFLKVASQIGKTSKLAKGTMKGDVYVTYGRLRTSAQASRANRLNLELYGPSILHSTYPPRPTMGPALQQVAPRLPAMIADEWAK